jgi:hypothetical protein
MSTWTLFVILWLSDGGVSVMEGAQFTKEGSCKQAALYLTSKPIAGVKKVAAACKERTDV